MHIVWLSVLHSNSFFLLCSSISRLLNLFSLYSIGPMHEQKFLGYTPIQPIATFWVLFLKVGFPPLFLISLEA